MGSPLSASAISAATTLVGASTAVLSLLFMASLMICGRILLVLPAPGWRSSTVICFFLSISGSNPDGIGSSILSPCTIALMYEPLGIMTPLP